MKASPILNPLKTAKNWRFSDVFRGYRKANALIEFLINTKWGELTLKPAFLLERKTLGESGDEWLQMDEWWMNGATSIMYNGRKKKFSLEFAFYWFGRRITKSIYPWFYIMNPVAQFFFQVMIQPCMPNCCSKWLTLYV